MRDEPVVVRLSPWKAGASLAVSAGLVALATVAVAKVPDAADVGLLVFFAVIFVFSASAFAGALATRRLVVDRDGVVLYGVRLAWDEIAGVALRKRRTTHVWPGFRSLEFKVRDPDLLLGQTPTRWGRRLRAWLGPERGRVASCSFTLADTKPDPVIDAIERWWGGRVLRPRP